MTDKLHHVLERLPGHRQVLLQRMMTDREFRGLCEDFGDAFEALRRWEGATNGQRKARMEEFARLLAELEGEILVELGVK